MKKNLIIVLVLLVMGLCCLDGVGAAADKGHSDILVVYFSATGTTKGVAEKIAQLTGADLFEIVPKQPYTAADLNWNDSGSRTSLERNDPSCRPEIDGDPADLDGYSMIFIGYPIWWGDVPHIMKTFAESYDFEEITMIPFCTSRSSGVGQSAKHLEESAEGGRWVEGTRLEGDISEDDLLMWIGEKMEE